MNIETYAIKHPKIKPGIILPETVTNMDNLPDGSKFLDVGCAEGNTIHWLSSKFQDRHKFYGVDLSKTRIQKAIGKNIGGAFFYTGNAETLPIESKAIDFVISSQVIEHVPDDIKMLNEIERVMVSGGKFQIDTVFKKKWAIYFYHSPSGWALDPTHVREYTNIDSFISKFPDSLRIQKVILTKSYRELRILPFLSFLPGWMRIRIPGYFSLFILGNKL